MIAKVVFKDMMGFAGKDKFWLPQEMKYLFWKELKKWGDLLREVHKRWVFEVDKMKRGALGIKENTHCRGVAEEKLSRGEIIGGALRSFALKEVFKEPRETVE